MNDEVTQCELQFLNCSAVSNRRLPVERAGKMAVTANAQASGETQAPRQL